MIATHAVVAAALRRGVLVRPDRCEECGAHGRIEGHHDDYLKPLNVRWLCPPCHGRADAARRRREGAKPRPVPMPALDEAAAATGIHRRTLQRWVKEGVLTPYRVRGDRRLFLDLDQIEEARKPRLREDR